MFQSLLIEGKEPPIIEVQGDVVKVTLLAGELSASFREFVAAEEQSGRQLGVDHLLVLRHLLRHPELDTATAARICQRSETEARELLSAMELNLGYLERGGTGRGTFWRLVGSLHTGLSGPGLPERDRRIDWETAKTRVLDIVRQRAAREEPGLTNEEARAITLLGRPQIKRLMQQLRDEGHVEVVGRGRAARWVYTPPTE
jgi:ATP-dependent DNA helicase RecG